MLPSTCPPTPSPLAPSPCTLSRVPVQGDGMLPNPWPLNP